jgi:hypothetical protein
MRNDDGGDDDAAIRVLRAQVRPARRCGCAPRWRRWVAAALGGGGEA